MNINLKVATLSLIATAIALSGCVSQRISSDLKRYGLDPPAI